MTKIIISAALDVPAGNPYEIAELLSRLVKDAQVAVLVRKAGRENGNFPALIPQGIRDIIIAQDAADLAMWNQILNGLDFVIK